MEFAEYTPNNTWNKERKKDDELDERIEKFLQFNIEHGIETDNVYLKSMLDEIKAQDEERNNSKNSSNFWSLQQNARNKYMSKFLPSIEQMRENNMNLSNDVTKRASETINYLTSKGLSREQAAGIAGNLMQESRFDTTILGDNGTSIGLAQWRKERREDLKEFASGMGRDKTDFHTQLDFIIHELNTTEKKAGNLLRQAQTVEEASDIFSKHYERPNLRYAHNDKRRNFAREFFNIS